MALPSAKAADHPILIVSDEPAGPGPLARLLPALRDAICSGGGPSAPWLSVRPNGRERGQADRLRDCASNAVGLVILTKVHNNSYSGEIALALDQLRDGPVRAKPMR